MKREFFALSLILIMFLMINMVSGSAVYLTGCKIEAEVTESFFIDPGTFYIKTIKTDNCNDSIHVDSISRIEYQEPGHEGTRNRLHNSIYEAEKFHIIGVGACPMTASGEPSCWEGWQIDPDYHNFSEIPLTISSLEELSCEVDKDCYPYGYEPSENDCGGCREEAEGMVCYEYTPLYCYLYENRVGCLNNICMTREKFECAKEGETVGSGFPDACCEGLVGVTIGEKNAFGQCDDLIGGYLCTNCGNSICEEWEDDCSCPEDCKISIWQKILNWFKNLFS